MYCVTSVWRLRNNACRAVNGDAPGGFKVVESREKVDINRPEVGAFRVARENVVEHRLTSADLAQFHLELSESRDRVDICDRGAT